MKTIPCILPGCGQEHEVKLTKSKNHHPCYWCDNWKMEVFFNEGLGLTYYDSLQPSEKLTMDSEVDIDL